MGRSRLLAWAFATGLVAGCFAPPNDDVLFRCEPGGASACPPDYVCLADGCCHREGTSLADDNFGLCVGSATGTDGAPGSSGTDTGATQGTDTGATQGSPTGSDSGSGSGSSSGAGSSDGMDGSSGGTESSSTGGL